MKVARSFANAGTSAIIVTGPCTFYGFLLGTDGVNDPTITIYDNIVAAGKEVVPTAVYDSSVLGLNGAMIGQAVKCANGLYMEITTGGTVATTTFYRNSTG